MPTELFVTYCISIPMILLFYILGTHFQDKQFALDDEKFTQLPEAPPVDVLTLEQENEKLLDQYHANMVRISEMEFSEMKRLS